MRAGLPVTVAGTTIDRQCASGLQAIALAARSVIFDGVEVAIGGGGESISLVQNEHMNIFHAVDAGIDGDEAGDAYMAMLDTAEIVAKRYNISRERQDEYQPREPAPHRRRAAGRPLQRRNRADQDHDGGHGQGRPRRSSYQEVTLVDGRRPRPDTTAEGLANIKPVSKGQAYHHRRQCQPALGRRISAAVIMSDKLAAQEGPEAARHLPRLRRGRLRARRDGRRSGRRGAAAAEAAWPEDRRYRSLGAERGLSRCR